MVKQNKKTPGRPKKAFVSKKPKTKIKSGPGRPRKETASRKVPMDNIFSENKGFVPRTIDDTKKKDLIILILFLLSFVLFVVSLYYTFIQDTSSEDGQDKSNIVNIVTGNIAYTTSEELHDDEVRIYTETPDAQSSIQYDIAPLTQEQQIIVDFYSAINEVAIDHIYKMTDARLKETNIFKTYYSRNRLTKFTDMLLAPKIVVTNIQEKEIVVGNGDIKHFEYTLEYILINNQQKFTEERSTTLIKRGEERKVGKLMCETKGCSMMPFFNPEKYK